MASKKRVYKPLDLAGLRLYRVYECYPEHPQWDRNHIVAATSPSAAACLIEERNKGMMYREQPIYKGYALNVLMPAGWYETLPVAEAAEMAAASLPDPVAPSSCEHPDRIYLCGGHGSGDGHSFMESVHVCRTCGQFHVFRAEDGRSIAVEFSISGEEVLAAAGQWVRLLRQSSHDDKNS